MKYSPIEHLLFLDMWVHYNAQTPPQTEKKKPKRFLLAQLQQMLHSNSSLDRHKNKYKSTLTESRNARCVIMLGTAYTPFTFSHSWLCLEILGLDSCRSSSVAKSLLFTFSHFIDNSVDRRKHQALGKGDSYEGSASLKLHLCLENRWGAQNSDINEPSPASRY